MPQCKQCAGDLPEGRRVFCTKECNAAWRAEEDRKLRQKRRESNEDESERLGPLYFRDPAQLRRHLGMPAIGEKKVSAPPYRPSSLAEAAAIASMRSLPDRGASAALARDGMLNGECRRAHGPKTDGLR